MYGSARNTHLQKIESIQNKCLLLIIEALQSTPIPTLCAETGILPLHFRRNYLTDRFLTKSMSYSSVPLIQITGDVLLRNSPSYAKEPKSSSNYKNTPFNCTNIGLQLFPYSSLYKRFPIHKRIHSAISFLITSSTTTFLKQSSF